MSAYIGKIHMVYHTDTGLVREHNEDSIAINSALGCMVLADGMGGYQAGEIASTIATEEITNEISRRLAQTDLGQQATNSPYHHASLLLQQAILSANQAIYQSAQDNSEHYGMGTTVVGALFYDNAISIAHVGDSRLYRLRQQNFETLTSDHSVLQELLDHGFYTPEQVRNSPNKNLVTRALGVNPDVEVSLQEQTVQADDIYLLCSDGLNDMLEDHEIATLLMAEQTDLAQTAKALTDAANAKGGLDNISVILAQVKLTDPKPKPWWKYWLFR